jgi:TRAP-type C4-dicarboxylate transport system substrate-binding protein
MVEALGADATPMSYGEVYQSLIQGVVSGAENNWPAYEDSRHHEAAKFYSLTQHVMAPEVLVVSGRTWDKLPRRIARCCALLRASQVPVMRKLWERREAEARALLAREGVQVNEITDRRAFERAVQPVWEQFVRTPEQRAIVNQIRALA